ncbi:hypothetical protein Plo01_48080 [Planobispora longispora]|uniref:DNA (cytosine-5-)-methyltransferase n=1 Tax=Planobispora longispora TaxID=28887 RepID=A0A8J3W6D6_9ACTN|nr:hypothetical protein Plo01_48080 [Planobispora longispora]
MAVVAESAYSFVRSWMQKAGVPANWELVGEKTARCRQAGKAFPPPVAAAVGREIAAVLLAVP